MIVETTVAAVCEPTKSTKGLCVCNGAQLVIIHSNPAFAGRDIARRHRFLCSNLFKERVTPPFFSASLLVEDRLHQNFRTEFTIATPRTLTPSRGRCTGTSVGLRCLAPQQMSTRVQSKVNTVSFVEWGPMTAQLVSLSPPSELKSSAAARAAVPPIRIILANSQAIYRAGINKVFALEADLRVVAQAETLQNLHVALQVFPADIVLLEGALLTATTNDSIHALLHAAPHLRIIVQVNQADETNTVELYRRGVRGVISRSIAPTLLVKCVRKVAEGETWIDNQSIHWVIEAYRAHAVALISPRVQPKLSDKEYAIIRCITQGMRNKEIAYQIGTSEQVIKNYLRKVYEKLGVSDRLELALYCLHHQLLKSREKMEHGSNLIQSRPVQSTPSLHAEYR